MSESESSKLMMVRNARQQPVELHLAERVLVVAPGGTAELAGSEVDSPQVQTLVRRRLIELRPAVVPAATAAAKPKLRRGTPGSVEGGK